MFRIRKSEFHFWFSFPNLSPEIAAKKPQKTGLQSEPEHRPKDDWQGRWYQQAPILPGPPYLRHPIQESHEVQ